MNHPTLRSTIVDLSVSLRAIKRFGAAVLLAAPLLLSAGCATGATPPTGVPRAEAVEQDKKVLTRLIAELQRSSRSFIYLRTQGFNLTDEEFEKLITTNNKVLRTTRIIRYDDKGARQIPGWPGVALTPEYKASSSPAPVKGK